MSVQIRFLNGRGRQSDNLLILNARLPKAHYASEHSASNDETDGSRVGDPTRYNEFGDFGDCPRPPYPELSYPYVCARRTHCLPWLSPGGSIENRPNRHLAGRSCNIRSRSC